MERKIFPLTSRLVFSPGLLGKVPEQELMESFSRHCKDDFGLAHEKLVKMNRAALTKGGELVSVFESKGGVRFRVVTIGARRLTQFEFV